ncbi:thiolase family protein [Rhodococcus opacus]
MTDAFVLGGVRTPVGRYGGSLSHLRTDDLLGRTMAAACERTSVPLDKIEDIVAGCVNPAHEGMGDIARWSALAAGFPDSVPAITVNRFCASSLSAAISIAHAIRSDEMGIGLACGVESMSRSGWALMKGDRRSCHAGRSSCSTRCGPARAALPTRHSSRATPTSR